MRQASSILPDALVEICGAGPHANITERYETGCVSAASVNGSSVTRDSRRVGKRGASMRSIQRRRLCVWSFELGILNMHYKLLLNLSFGEIKCAR